MSSYGARCHARRIFVAFYIGLAINFTGHMSPCVVHAELFTSLTGLENLLQIEYSLAGQLRNYVSIETQRLNRLHKLAEEFERHSVEGGSDPELHLGNPVYTYLFIKRLTVDWKRTVEEDILHDNGQDFMTQIDPLTRQLPTKDDLDGAGDALFRLQDTYDLTTDQIANGGISGSPKMPAAACYQLGLTAYHDQDFLHAAIWMQEGLNVLSRETEKTIEKKFLLDFAQYSQYKLGNYRHALNLTKEWQLLEPLDNKPSDNIRIYEIIISQQIEAAKHQSYNSSNNESTPNSTVSTSNESEVHLEKTNTSTLTEADFYPRGDPIYLNTNSNETYQRLCRGEQTHNYVLKDRLTCRYLRHHPMFFIRPIKEELVYDDPPIAIYHDVIVESEINVIRAIAKSKLQRSRVVDTSTDSTDTTSRIRTSQRIHYTTLSAWLYDTENRTIQRISSTSAAISNLSEIGVEPLQVLNYGIGGHYNPHYDFFTEKEITKVEICKTAGNRIATFICYLSSVTAGGATVFPEIGVTLWPEKGSCALWYNLRTNGDRDTRTKHGACPVLTGTKWVCNKWFHANDQAFKRKCSASDTEKTVSTS